MEPSPNAFSGRFFGDDLDLFAGCSAFVLDDLVDLRGVDLEDFWPVGGFTAGRLSGVGVLISLGGGRRRASFSSDFTCAVRGDAGGRGEKAGSNQEEGKRAQQSVIGHGSEGVTASRRMSVALTDAAVKAHLSSVAQGLTLLAKCRLEFGCLSREGATALSRCSGDRCRRGRGGGGLRDRRSARELRGWTDCCLRPGGERLRRRGDTRPLAGDLERDRDRLRIGPSW